MPPRSSLLQKAFRLRDHNLSKQAHTKIIISDALNHPDEHQSSGIYLGDAVYGALDGIVTTFAVVSGVVGADLSPSIILILGFANLLGDGFSMAAGNYLSLKSQQDYHQEEYNRESWEIDNYPEGEVEEIRQIYKAKGFRGEDLEKAVKIITSDKERWIKTMMIEELGIVPEQKSALMAGFITFTTFLICGFLPLFTFVLLYFFPELQGNAFLFSCVMTALSIFTVGSLRSLIIAKSWWQAGSEMLIVGGAASSVAYLVGYFLRGLVS